jgi:hypothetical protein
MLIKNTYLRLVALVVVTGGLIGAVLPADAHDRRDRDRTSFSVTLNAVQLGYHDGYYDHGRRWHPWRSNRERAWYRQNHRDSYYNMRRHRDRDRYRRDWRQGRRDDWRREGYHH